MAKASFFQNGRSARGRFLAWLSEGGSEPEGLRGFIASLRLDPAMEIIPGTGGME